MHVVAVSEVDKSAALMTGLTIIHCRNVRCCRFGLCIHSRILAVVTGLTTIVTTAIIVGRYMGEFADRFKGRISMALVALAGGWDMVPWLCGTTISCAMAVTAG